jgi:hypothetical protein
LQNIHFVEFLHESLVKMNDSAKVTSCSTESKPSTNERVEALKSFSLECVESVTNNTVIKLSSADGSFLQEVAESLDNTDGRITLGSYGDFMFAVDDENSSQRLMSQEELNLGCPESAAVSDSRKEFTCQISSAPAQLSRLVNAERLDVSSQEVVENCEASNASGAHKMARHNALQQCMRPALQYGRRRVGIYGTCKTKMRTEMYK